MELIILIRYISYIGFFDIISLMIIFSLLSDVKKDVQKDLEVKIDGILFI